MTRGNIKITKRKTHASPNSLVIIPHETITILIENKTNKNTKNNLTKQKLNYSKELITAK